MGREGAASMHRQELIRWCAIADQSLLKYSSSSIAPIAYHNYSRPQHVSTLAALSQHWNAVKPRPQDMTRSSRHHILLCIVIIVFAVSAQPEAAQSTESYEDELADYEGTRVRRTFPHTNAHHWKKIITGDVWTCKQFM